MGTTATTNKTQTQSQTQKTDLGQLLECVNKADCSREDTLKFKEVLKEQPAISAICGDLADQVKDLIIDKNFTTPLRRESIRAHIETLKKNLEWDNSTALERLIIETIINSWMDYHNVSASHTVLTGKAYVLKTAEHIEKRLTLAHKRFLKSIESLAKVRKLLKATSTNTIVNYDPVVYGKPSDGVME